MPVEFGIPVRTFTVIGGGFIIATVAAMVLFVKRSLQTDVHSPPPLQETPIERRENQEALRPYGAGSRSRPLR